MLNLAAVLLLYMSAPTAAVAQDDVDPIVARFAGHIRETIGRQIAGQMQITGVRGEGRTLILSVEMAAGASELIGPVQVASIMATHICAVPRAGNIFFGDGRALRVEVVRAGRGQGSATVDRCTGPVGEGLTAAAVATAMQSLVGREDNLMRIVAIRGEGNILIVTLALPTGRHGSAAALSDVMVQGFCGSADFRTGFFGRGLVLRVDTMSDDDAPVPGPAVTACPAQ